MTYRSVQKNLTTTHMLYCFKAHPVNAGTALIGLDKIPGVIEDIFPVYLVVERIKAIGRFLLGLGIELPL